MEWLIITLLLLAVAASIWGWYEEHERLKRITRAADDLDRALRDYLGADRLHERDD